MNDHAINIADLVKKFHAQTALNAVSLKIPLGERFGLIGPDGAGKTSLIRILCGLMQFDSGSVIVQGFDLKKQAHRVRSIVGYMPQRFSLYPDLTVHENLRFYADLFGVPATDRKRRSQELLEFSRLEPFLKRKAGKLSGGMKQKLALTCTLIHQPKILFLDEPTTGVDPLSRHEFWLLLDRLSKQGITLFITTSYLEEADRCHRVALMGNGEILEIDSPDNIGGNYPHPLFEISTPQPFEAASILEKMPDIGSVQIFSGGIHLSIKSALPPSYIRKQLIKNGVKVSAIRPIEPGIEDVFVEKLSSAP